VFQQAKTDKAMIPQIPQPVISYPNGIPASIIKETKLAIPVVAEFLYEGMSLIEFQSVLTKEANEAKAAFVANNGFEFGDRRNAVSRMRIAAPENEPETITAINRSVNFA
jgi:hypothetical protein